MIKGLFQSKLRKDVVGTYLSQGFVLIAAFILNKILSNLLSVEEFGQYNMIRKSAYLISFLMLGGICITIPRYLPRLTYHKFLRVTSGFIVGCLIYMVINSSIIVLICLIAKSVLCKVIIGTDNIQLLLIILGYSFFLAIFTSAISYFRGIDKFRLYNLYWIIGSIITLLPIFLWNNITIQNIYIIWGVGYLVASVIIFLIEAKKNRWLIYRTPFKYASRQLKEVYKYSLPRLVGEGFLYLYGSFPVIYVGNKIGLDMAAYFSVGITILSIVTPFFATLGTILLPYVSKAISENRINSAIVLIRKLLILFLLTSGVIVLVMSLWMPWIIKLLFSDEYTSVAEIARIIIWGLIPHVLYLLYRNPIDAVSKVPYNTIVMGIAIGVLIISFFFCESLIQFAYCYLGVSIIKGISIFCCWQYLKNKISKS